MAKGFNIFFVALIATLFAPLSMQAQCNPDFEAPLWVNCPPSVTMETDNGCQPYKWTPPTLTDNCTAPLDTLNTNTNYNGACIPANNSVKVIYLATDISGNVGICSFTITIEPSDCVGETISPDLSDCPTNVISTSTNGSCVPVSWIAPTAVDNCDSLPRVTTSHANGSCFNVGTTNVIYTATDANNNTSTCSFSVVVNTVNSITGNMITNFNFESGTLDFAGTSNATISTNAYSELSAIQIGTGTGNISYTQNIAANTTYNFSAWNDLSSSSAGGTMSMTFLDINSAVISGSGASATITSTTYLQQFLSAVAPANAVYIQLSVVKTNTSGYVYTDSWSLTTPPPAIVPFVGNVIVNFGFEAGLTGYDDVVSSTVSTTESRCGSKAAKIAPSAQGRVAITRDVVGGSTCSFKSYSKVSGRPSACNVGIKFYDASANYIPSSDKNVKVTSCKYTETNLSAVAPSNAAYVKIYATKTCNEGSLVTDDWCYKETRPTTPPSTGTGSTGTGSTSTTQRNVTNLSTYHLVKSRKYQVGQQATVLTSINGNIWVKTIKNGRLRQ
jgi:hypothetical protein